MTPRFRLATFIYSVICGIPVSFFLCLSSAIVAQSDLEGGILTINFTTIDWANFATNFVIALTLSILISNFIPLTAIGRWFTALFHVPNETYTGNIKYRLLATLSSTIIFYLIISPTLTLINCVIYPLIKHEPVMSGGQILLSMLINMPILLLVGFVASLINDLAAYKAAHYIDHSF
ncbi:MAG: hypothetical protein IKP50_02435 [Bacilli bacterium]|nr:hypothetical protein [Bacilli bacterium]